MCLENRRAIGLELAVEDRQIRRAADRDHATPVLGVLGVCRTDRESGDRVIPVCPLVGVRTAGGLVVGMATLDITPLAYLEETRRAISGTQFGLGLVKSVAFGILVALAGCHIGLRAGRSAADVGRAATSAVVAGIIGVIALDAVFAVCANALGI